MCRTRVFQSLATLSIVWSTSQASRGHSADCLTTFRIAPTRGKVTVASWWDSSTRTRQLLHWLPCHRRRAFELTFLPLVAANPCSMDRSAWKIVTSKIPRLKYVWYLLTLKPSCTVWTWQMCMPVVTLDPPRFRLYWPTERVDSACHVPLRSPVPEKVIRNWHQCGTRHHH